MQQFGADAGRLARVIDAARPDGTLSPVHYVSLILSFAALGTIAVAPYVVDHLMSALVKLDPEGEISKPYLLLRPFYSVAIILAVFAALQSAMHARGKSLLDAMLRGRTARSHVAISVAFIFALTCLYVYAMLHAAFYLTYFFEDGPIEDLTAVLYFGSVVVYGAALLGYMRLPDRLLPIAAIFLLCALAALLIGLEEISYGQRIFGWATPAAFAGNLQHESNVHNLFDFEMMDFLEWVGATAVYVVVCLFIYLRCAWQSPWLQYAPHESLLPLVAAVALFSSHGGPQEVFENGAALFALLYAIQILRQVRAGQPSRAAGAARS